MIMSLSKKVETAQKMNGTKFLNLCMTNNTLNFMKKKKIDFYNKIRTFKIMFKIIKISNNINKMDKIII